MTAAFLFLLRIADFQSAFFYFLTKILTYG